VLAREEWSMVILDEAQNIKNPETRQTQAIRKLRAEHRIALTGTPVENRLTELWSIFHFLNPGYLGSREAFRRQFARPIERTGDENAASTLKQLVQPFILRRLKSDPAIIQDLPDKLEMKDYCALTREQVTLYEAATKEALEKIQDSEGMERRGLILATMTRLKQICNHPAHFLADGSTLAGRSGKLNRLVALLEEVLARNERALLFTQFSEMGELLRAALTHTFAREVFFLHGGTSRAARDRMVRRFQEDPKAPPLFVLSIKAGGVGLNLTAANHVFHYDRWWNPAVENQATDRAFRIGQKRAVEVHKFICTGTLEEKIDDLIDRKRALAEQIVGDGEGWLTELSTDELHSLFTLGRTLVEEEE
jgi:SNF2 family DNA or RNA helicase